MDEVMACGDSDNDITKIEAAGLGIAMANSAPKILNICRNS
jgi:hydroxymethylpyrimidine pyrophosphatase-like HAD family hydrolase